MARLNIEECWWSDPRRTKLLLKIGFQADAAAVNMWRIAQGFWADGRMLIPKHIFDTIEFAEDLLGVRLAELRGEFVYVRGSSAWLDWTAEKRAAAKAGGKKSSQRPRNAKGQLQKASKQKPSKTQAEPKLIQASDSDSDSGSGSDSDLGSEELHPPVAAGSSKELRSEIWDRYSNAFFTRYKTEPVRNASVNSKIKLLAERLGDEAKDVVEFYVTHNNAFYVRSTHSIGLCLQDAEGLRTQWATGRMTSQKEAQQADSSTALAAQLKRLREEAL